MRYLPTSPEKVEALKKQAKKLQRKGGGKHADLLNTVAKRAGYDHWHHVVQCAGRGSAVRDDFTDLLEVCATVTEGAKAGKQLLVTSKDAIGGVPMVLFSTADGDAWLLEAELEMALCLSWHGEPKAPTIRQNGNEVEIHWDGPFELRGPFFEIETALEGVGHRAIAGYPVDQIREFLNKVMTFDRKMNQVILQSDVVDITPDIFQQLVTKGWEPETLKHHMANGAGYSPGRDSILLPPVSSEHEEFDDVDDRYDSTADQAQRAIGKPQDKRQKSNDWFDQWVDKAIEGSKRMTADPVYQAEIRSRTK